MTKRWFVSIIPLLGVVMSYIFDWDEDKNRINYQKHGITFEEASTVFDDENLEILPDEDHSNDEERFLAIGYSAGLVYQPRLLLVCHCYRMNDTIIRLISARRPSKHERKNYEERSSM